MRPFSILDSGAFTYTLWGLSSPLAMDPHPPLRGSVRAVPHQACCHRRVRRDPHPPLRGTFSPREKAGPSSA